MQYFIGYSGFSYEPVFDASLFVDLRKRFGADQINLINELIMGLVTEDIKEEAKKQIDQPNNVDDKDESTAQPVEETSVELPGNKGDLIVDATACPQDISYPTDLNLLNAATEQSEKL